MVYVLVKKTCQYCTINVCKLNLRMSDPLKNKIISLFYCFPRFNYSPSSLQGREEIFKLSPNHLKGRYETTYFFMLISNHPT